MHMQDARCMMRWRWRWHIGTLPIVLIPLVPLISLIPYPNLDPTNGAMFRRTKPAKLTCGASNRGPTIRSEAISGATIR